MNRQEVNGNFAAKVMEYISHGYTISSQVMNGSEDEISKVDVSDGKETIRILMKKEHFKCYGEILSIIVGRVAGNHLEVISEEKFCYINDFCAPTGEGQQLLYFSTPTGMRKLAEVLNATAKDWEDKENG